jgi:hypothetical protein
MNGNGCKTITSEFGRRFHHSSMKKERKSISIKLVTGHSVYRQLLRRLGGKSSARISLEDRFVQECSNRVHAHSWER